MLDLPLIPGAPWSVKIAADPRLSTTDYGDDAIYALSAAGGPLGLFSSYGGRCDGMLFDLLWRSSTLGLAYGVEEYAAVPTLRGYGPSYALLDIEPFEGIKTRAAFVAHSSHAVTCVLDVRNATDAPLDLIVTGGLRIQFPEQLASDLEPAAPLRLTLPDAHHSSLITNHSIYGAHVATTNLRLAALWDEPGAFDSDPLPEERGWTIWRHRELALAPGETGRLVWVLLTPRRGDALVTLARELLLTDWDAELARHEAASANIPIVETDNVEWDAAIACAYRLAARCYLSGSGDATHRPEVPAPDGRTPDIHTSGSGYPPLPHPSFVFTRIPERGYPRDGDPEQHSWQWNGQVATEAYVNAPQVASFAPELAKAVLRNYLHVQRDDGFIDWKPGLAGQRAGWDCIPLLAPIARMIYDYTDDLDFLREVYGELVRHLDRWFAPENDRDGDGFPEWTHTIQSAFDDNPSFVPFRAWAQGADISKAECPDLGAYLYREHRELIVISHLVSSLLSADDTAESFQHLEADRARLRERAEQLRIHVESLWDEERAIYTYRDRDTHLTHGGDLICELTGAGDTMTRWQGDKVTEHASIQCYPVIVSPPHLVIPSRRVVVRVEGTESPGIKIILRGTDGSGVQQVETFGREAFGWWGPAPYVVSVTTEQHFTRIDEVQVEGITGQYRVRVGFVDYRREDQTLLLPLWARIPDAAQAQALVQRTLTDPERFWRPYGIPNCSAQDAAYNSGNRNGSGGVWMMWNTMLGEGLCDYGYFAEAWELFERILAAQLASLSDEQCFREAYDCDTGEGLGDRDYLWGSVPLHLLTRLHGIIVVSPRKVRLLPADLCDHRITVRHYGVVVIREGEQATITWADGEVELLTSVGRDAEYLLEKER